MNNHKNQNLDCDPSDWGFLSYYLLLIKRVKFVASDSVRVKITNMLGKIMVLVGPRPILFNSYFVGPLWHHFWPSQASFSWELCLINNMVMTCQGKKVTIDGVLVKYLVNIFLTLTVGTLADSPNRWLKFCIVLQPIRRSTWSVSRIRINWCKKWMSGCSSYVSTLRQNPEKINICHTFSHHTE